MTQQASDSRGIVAEFPDDFEWTQKNKDGRLAGARVRMKMSSKEQMPATLGGMPVGPLIELEVKRRRDASE